MTDLPESRTRSATRSARPGGRRTALVAGLVAAGVLMVLPADAGPSSPTVRDAAPSARAAAPQVPSSCRPTPNPPPTEYGFVARFEEGSIEAGPLTLDDLDISVCGIIRLVASPAGTSCPVSAELRVPADGVRVTSLRATLDLIPGKPLEVPVELQARPTVSAIPCTGDSEDGLELDLNLVMEGRAGVFGLECAIPFTGRARSVVTGPLRSPPWEGEASLKGDGLTVGTIANPGRLCPGDLPAGLADLTGLPYTDVVVDLDGKVAVYQDPV